ncbi:hypothetical protein ColTof4_08035 [Colletotrichum tofieldiae]|nr:hypothetical protein ColTof3_02441 [Colletotrichum tofieldiae]GKT75612.1 hypothetical protein ColTof4_08035 [Colletotrichum tofieldiae]GKT83298.1 hypothetical protein Ct61P_01148 [Colletotrichum tofieldiae]
MDESTSSSRQVITDEPVNRNEMTRDLEGLRRRSASADSDDATSDEERTETPAPRRVAHETPEHRRRRRRRLEAEMQSDGIFGVLFCLSNFIYCF